MTLDRYTCEECLLSFWLGVRDAALEEPHCPRCCGPGKLVRRDRFDEMCKCHRRAKA